MSLSRTHSEGPLVSVVVEGYNESRQLGTAGATVEALRRQEGIALERVELVLVGSAAQSDEWGRLYSTGTPFHSVKAVALDDPHYFRLKNEGARVSSGEIIAFTDSDVRMKPAWLASAVGAIEEGADVSVGLTLFDGGGGPDSALMQALASITWGWIIGKGGGSAPVGFMDHNVVIRAEVFRRHRYRTDLGRVLASPLLYRALKDAGTRFALQPKQQAAHHFTWTYWLCKLHFRYGYEVFKLRRMDADYPNRWLARLKALEPPATMLWHVMLDQPRWFRFSRLLGLGAARRAALLPIVFALSVVARAAEMCGMYATLLDRDAMRRWAENV